MRALFLLVACGSVLAQTTGRAYEALSQAYESLKLSEYQAAIVGFEAAIQAAPDRPSIRKDLAYTYLKIGENEFARAQFGEAMRLDPADASVALEYAFLCYEGRDKREARRIFDRLRKAGNPVAERAFQNVDRPLAEGIARWREAIAKGADDPESHFELAALAEERDELQLAAEQYRLAWLRRPEHRNILVDLGRVSRDLGREDDAISALLAASRSDDARTAETARELLPARYPYVYEFRAALQLDPHNANLRRELAYLLLEMHRPAEAETEFRILADPPSNDLLSAAQIGLLLYGRGDRAGAKVYLDRVLAGGNQDLANRIRAVLSIPQTPFAASGADPMEMAENSIRAGFLNDALKYLSLANAANPEDLRVVYRMAWAANILHRDREAFRWFALARHSDDPAIASAADRGWRSLRPAEEPIGFAGWFFPLYSTRWTDAFGYGQVRADFHRRWPIYPYLSVRFDTDTRSNKSLPELYSGSSLIFAGGLRTSTWHGVTAWFEGGSAANYLTRHMLPDFRGGVSAARSKGRTLAGELPGAFAEVNGDAIFLSRFGNDFLVYAQSRLGYTFGRPTLRAQLFWCANLTVDTTRQFWANFIETGPGIRLRPAFMPKSMYVMTAAVTGKYLHTLYFDYPLYSDLKVGVWYAFTR